LIDPRNVGRLAQTAIRERLAHRKKTAMTSRRRWWIGTGAAVIVAFGLGVAVHPVDSARSATADFVFVRGADHLSGTTNKASLALCPAGRRLVAGGFDLSGKTQSVRVTRNFPYRTASGDGVWAVGARSDTGETDWRVVAWAVCI
jgi:hypothetical protein